MLSGLVRCTVHRLTVEAKHNQNDTSVYGGTVSLSPVLPEGYDPGHVAHRPDISTRAARALNKCITTQTGV
jgi:hypothetical protein